MVHLFELGTDVVGAVRAENDFVVGVIGGIVRGACP